MAEDVLEPEEPSTEDELSIVFTPPELFEIRDRAISTAELIEEDVFPWWYDKLVKFAQLADELSTFFATAVAQYENEQDNENWEIWKKVIENMKGSGE